MFLALFDAEDEDTTILQNVMCYSLIFQKTWIFRACYNILWNYFYFTHHPCHQNHISMVG